MAEGIAKKDFWTQAEVAEHFRVSKSTIKNWREKGYLPYFQLPDSTRVLYFDEGIREISKQFMHTGKEVVRPKKLKRSETKKVKPCISSSEREWRIE